MAASKHKLAVEADAANRPSKKSKTKDQRRSDADNGAHSETQPNKSVEAHKSHKKAKDKKPKVPQAAGTSNTPGELVAASADDQDPDALRKAEKAAKKARKQARRELRHAASEAAVSDNPHVKPEEKCSRASEHDRSQEQATPVTSGKDKQKKSKKSKVAVKAESTASRTNGARPAYVQTMSLSSLPQADIDAFLAEHQIVVTDPRNASGITPFRPVVAFEHLPSTNLLEKRPSPFAGFKTPTPIQAASWPYTLSGRDAVGVAETGSGKTMAFALPCIEAISADDSSSSGTRAIVISPTRELAMQTHEQMARLAALAGLRCVCIYGGASKDDQRALLQRGCDIVVATPGRLKDMMSDNTIKLGEARFVVLDEADRMLDKGFEDDIKHIVGSCPPREARQTLMFTATWPQSVQALAATFMVDPVRITIGGGRDDGGGGVELQANARIAQSVEVVEPRDKEGRLLDILKQRQQGARRSDRILVFCLYKKEATRIEALLSRKGIRVAGIHGDLRQEQRTRSLEAFKSGATPVLVATDVAARGLDIPEVKLVINVTFPLTIEDYVHRIGRTGRAGNKGEAITLFTIQDKAHSGSLINVLKGANQPVPEDLLRFGTTVKKKTHDMYGSFFKDVDMNQKATKITFD